MHDLVSPNDATLGAKQKGSVSAAFATDIIKDCVQAAVGREEGQVPDDLPDAGDGVHQRASSAIQR